MTGRFQTASILLLVLLFSASQFGCGGAQRIDKGPSDNEPTVSCDIREQAPFEDEINTAVQLLPLCYEINQSVRIVEGGSLNVAPNAVILFGADAGIVVHGGALYAQGTREAPIKFAGKVENPGYWAGIYVHHSNGQQVILSNTIIRHGGGTDYLETDSVRAGLLIHGDSSDTATSVPLVKITSNRLESNAGYGVYIGPNANLQEFSNNKISKSQNQPVRVALDRLQQIDTSNDILDNNVKQIYLEGKQLGERFPQAGAATNIYNWPVHLGVSYYIAENFTVYAPLIIQEGTTFEFAQNTGLIVKGENAYVSAIGTQEANIIFTGETKSQGSWKGLLFESSISPKNRLDYVRIEFAGAPKSNSEEYTAGLTITNPFSDEITTVNVTNSEISSNDGYGFFVGKDSSFGDFINNTIFGNTVGAGVIPLRMLSRLNNDSRFTGNGNGDDHILVTPATMPKEEVLTGWNEVNVPYRIIGDAVVKGSINVNSGVTIEMSPESLFILEGSKSNIKAIGTPSKITFKNTANEFGGNWAGFLFLGSSSTQNIFDNVDIQSAGVRSVTYRNLYPGAAITLDSGFSSGDSSYLEMQNSRILNSQGWGVWSDDENSLNELGGNIINGTLGQYCMPPNCP